LQLHSARKHPARTFGQVKGGIGAVTTIGEQSIFVTAQGGQIEVSKLRYDGGKKLPAPQACAEAGIAVGAVLGE
jgi:methionyl-tRNA formyltransferase